MIALGSIVFIVALLCALAAGRSHRQLMRWLGRDPWHMRRWMRAGLLVATCLLVSAAWLRAAHEPRELSAGGSDLILLMDVSRSMDASDTPPSRLRRAKRLAQEVVAASDESRVGLAIFAGAAFAVLPLTHDRDALQTYLRALDSDLISHQGSDLIQGLRVAADLFDPRSERSRNLLVFSDGEHSGADLQGSAARLNQLGVYVDAVGFGTPMGKSIEVDGERRVRSRRVDTPFEQLTRPTGGRYLKEWEDQPDARSLAPLTVVAGPVEPPRRSNLEFALILALIALGTELLLSCAPTGPILWLRRSATPVAALMLLTCQAQNRIEQADRIVNDEPRRALSLYRRTERRSGSSPSLDLRIGNASYRLDRNAQAAAAYLKALRGLDPGARGERFAANFNLGNTLLRQNRYAEAQDAFWEALEVEPSSLAAKFNYEWAQQRVEPEPAPPSTGKTSASPEAGEARPGEGEDERTRKRSAESPPLGQEESRRWLDSLEQQVREPLKREIERALGDGDTEGRQQW